jgi:hypothetical protein
VGILERLDPRHWGGRRVLRFLTSLALVALTFVVRVDVSAAPTVGTTAERPAAAVAPVEVVASEAGAAAADAGAAAEGATGPTGSAPTGTTTQVVPGGDAAPPAGSRPASHGSRAPPTV